ncbi:hypothetical protein MMC24_003432 [Lignoscripta atroalba]|nr:hypothetical protein [Lignoscripta atroalba]
MSTSPSPTPTSASTDPLSFSISEDFVPSRPPKSAGITTLSFNSLLNPPLKLQEDLKEGCGGQMWPAGMVLAKYLLKRKDEWRGKTMFVRSAYVSPTTVVELGAGGGLVGLALALGLTQSHPTEPPLPPLPPIHITDLPPLLPLQQENLSLNYLPPTLVTSTPLSWGTPLSISALPPTYHQPSILLAADCVYFEPAFPLLLQTMNEMIGAQTVCWFCFVKRRRADMGFVRGLRKGFEVREVDLRKEEDEEGGEKSEKGVFL